MLKRFALFFCEVLFIDDDLIHVLVEPSVAHDVVAVYTGILAPTVFDSPAVRLTVIVDIDTLEDHGVGHEALAIIEALSFIHGELGVEERFEVKSVQIHNAAVANAALADIAAEPNRQAVLHLGDGCRFQVFNRQVKVLDGATLCDVTEERDGVGLAVGLIGRRRIDEADVPGKIHVDVLFEE